MLRPAVPSAPIAGWANAAVLNHCSISSLRGRPLSSTGSPMMSARSVVTPSKLRSIPDEIVIGAPVCSVTIADTVQSLASAFTNPSVSSK